MKGLISSLGIVITALMMPTQASVLKTVAKSDLLKMGFSESYISRTLKTFEKYKTEKNKLPFYGVITCASGKTEWSTEKTAARGGNYEQCLFGTLTGLIPITLEIKVQEKNKSAAATIGSGIGLVYGDENLLGAYGQVDDEQSISGVDAIHLIKTDKKTCIRLVNIMYGIGFTKTSKVKANIYSIGSLLEALYKH